MYKEPTTWFGEVRRLTAMPETTIDEDGSGAEERARLVDEALHFALERRKAGPAGSAREVGPTAESGRALTDRDQETEDLQSVMNLVPMGLRRGPTVTLHALQEWEGYVVEINQNEFTARLLDVTARASFEEEEADIPFAEISDNDLDKIRLGSIFRWVIGYERSAAGTTKRVSQIVFRDLPAVTKSDLQAAEAWALKMATAFKR